MKNRFINILGTKYTIKTELLDEQEPRLEDNFGIMDFSTKEILISKIEKTNKSVADIKVFKNKILRHEIIHAFLYESGLYSNSKSVESWALNEEMVDWIAIQWHKINKLFKELNI